MRERAFDPRRLDVTAFARDGAQLHGELPFAALPRLAGSVEAGDAGATVVSWHAQGSLPKPAGGAAGLPALHLRASAKVTLQCQRCLQPLPTPLAVDTCFRFAPDEDEAARLDAESEDDVLVLVRDLDLQALLEDELLLALPLVPRHERCSPPRGPAEADDGPAPENPFAALASLRKPGGPR